MSDGKQPVRNALVQSEPVAHCERRYSLTWLTASLIPSVPRITRRMIVSRVGSIWIDPAESQAQVGVSRRQPRRT